MSHLRFSRGHSAIWAISAVLVTVCSIASAQTQISITQYKYDLVGNRIQVIDPLGHVSDTKYDALNRAYQVILPAPAAGIARPIISTNYDGLDQIATITDPRKLVTTYTMDGLGNQNKLASPDTGSTSNTFDAAGNLKTSTDSRGKVTTYSYDALNRVTNIAYSSGPATSFEYDGGINGATNAKGHLTKMTDESGTTTYSYNRFGRLLGKTQMVIAGSFTGVFTVSYEYGTSGGATGKLTSMTYPSGSRVNYVYNTAGILSRISLNPTNANGSGTNAAISVDLLKDLVYAPFGAVAAWSWGNSTTTSVNGYARSFDLDGRIATYSLGNVLTTGALRTVSYDAASRIKTYAHSATGGTILDNTFAYDNLDRLTGYSDSTTSQAFQYDANGNRTKATFGSNVYGLTIDPATNRLTATTGPLPAKTYQYDGAGNVTSDGNLVNTYSARGRMSSVKVGTTTVTQLFNGLGQRVQRSNGAGMFVYDETGQLIGEYDGTSGRAVSETVFLGDLPVVVLQQSVTGAAPSKVTTTNVHYIYPDHLGTGRVITRASDNRVVWRWDSDPFGLFPPNENPDGLGTFTYNLRMPGQYYDRDTNLFYNYYRDYDPQTGRYLQSDPIGLNGGINTFAYVRGNPVGMSDAFGLAPRRLDPSSQECMKLEAKIKRKSDLIAKLGRDLYKDIQHLPLYPSISDLPVKFSRLGHAERLGREIEFRKNDIQNYNDKCGPPPPPVPAEICFPDTDTRSVAKDATKAAAGAGILYWIISEGSRLFPPRNLIPIP
jgi:RHS repeat-associated protein